MVHYFHPIAFVEQMKLIIIKEDIDLSSKIIWISQFNKEEGTNKKGCWRTCHKILINYGLGEKSGYRDNLIQVVIENSTKKTIEVNKSKAKEGVKYIDKELEKGNPIIVGTHYKFGSNINEGTTDHFVVIVGRKYVEGIQRYIFWDVGTRRGASTEWKFELQNDKLIAEKTYKQGNKTYTVTQVRKNIGYEYN